MNLKQLDTFLRTLTQHIHSSTLGICLLGAKFQNQPLPVSFSPQNHNILDSHTSELYFCNSIG